MVNYIHGIPEVTVGLDLGDKYSHLFILDVQGEVLEEGRLRTTPEAFRERFGAIKPARVAMEVGTHSLWAHPLLKECGHEVFVANSSTIRSRSRNRRKTDKRDAEDLAREARFDPRKLKPIKHRSLDTQADLGCLRARDALVRNRTLLINHVRGAVKSSGGRLPKCDSRAFPRKVVESIPEKLKTALCPILDTIKDLSTKIKDYEDRIETLTKKKYPQAKRILQVTGVGPITALAFLLIVTDPSRFPRRRNVGAYVGLVPGKWASGESDPQLRISKAGDRFLRRLLVSSAQYILGPFGPDTDLRRHGELIAQRGGKNAKKRAVVAVARKLSVLLLSLWVSGETYEPLRNSEPRKKRASKNLPSKVK